MSRASPRSGPVYLVTGATAGIGREVARELAGRGGRVLMVARDAERGESARREVEAAVAGRGGATAGSAEVLLADLSSRSEIRDLARTVGRRTDRLDALVNNAGVYAKERRVSPDGLELQFAVNYAAPYLLSRLLLPLLRESAPSRIVNVASMEHRLGRIRFDDLQLSRGYRPARAYRQSKLAVVLFTRELARRIEGSGVTANAVHPGVVYTKLVHTISPLARLVKWILKSPAEGAEGPVFLATAPEVEGVNGAYFRGTRRTDPSRRARDPEKARRLWRRTEVLVGLDGAGDG